MLYTAEQVQTAMMNAMKETTSRMAKEDASAGMAVTMLGMVLVATTMEQLKSAKENIVPEK